MRAVDAMAPSDGHVAAVFGVVDARPADARGVEEIDATSARDGARGLAAQRFAKTSAP